MFTERSRPVRSLVAFTCLCVALVLGACETTGEPQAVVPENRSTAALATPANPPAPAARAAPVRIPTQSELMGADTARAEALLGTPALRRTDRGSEMWQYPSDDCVLFVFFYPDAAGAMELTFLTASAGTSGRSPSSDDACIASAVRAAAARPAVTS